MPSTRLPSVRMFASLCARAFHAANSDAAHAARMPGTLLFVFASRRRHTRWPRDWSSDVRSSDLTPTGPAEAAPAARNGFDALDLPEALRSAVDALGFTSPSPIQEQAIPSLLEGRDVIGVAQTGTGKTAAFGLPLLAAVDPSVREEIGRAS